MQRSTIIVAGGSGKRMGAAIPKQFLLLHGEPLLFHTLRAFHAIFAMAQAGSAHIAASRRVRSAGRPSKSCALRIRLVFRSRGWFAWSTASMTF